MSSSTESTSHSVEQSTAESTNQSTDPVVDGSGYVPIRDAITNLHSSLKDSQFGLVRSAVNIAGSIGDRAMSIIPDSINQSINQYGSPLIDQLDHQFATAFTRIQAFKSTANGGDLAQAYLMPAEWFTAVDAALSDQSINQSMKLSSADLGVLLQTFCMAASYQFLTLQRTGQATSDLFIAALRPELDRVWNDQLIEPARTFYEQAEKVFNEDASSKDSFTTRSFIERLRPHLNAAWEHSVRTSFHSIQQASQIVFVSALHEFSTLRAKSKSTNQPISELRVEFIDAMKRKVGDVWNAELETQINELFDVWTARAGRRDSSPAARMFDRYQYVLLTAQHAFDRVLPPVQHEVKPEDEVKQPEMESSNEPASITSLVGHVTGRIQERGVVSNVTTASTNSVREGVALAATGVKTGVKAVSDVAHSVTTSATNAAHKVVEPVISRAERVASPYVDAAKPVVNAVHQQLQHRQIALQSQLNDALAATRARIEALQAYLSSLTEATKASVVNTTTNAASTVAASLPESITSTLTEVQTRLTSAAKYAQQLKAEGSSAAVHEIAQLSATYAELARTLFNQQVNSFTSQLNAERLSTLAEDARVSVAQMLHYTKQQLDLERRVNDEDAEIDDQSFNQSLNQ